MIRTSGDLELKHGPKPLGPDLCDLSVLIPLHNEEENVQPLYHELKEVLDATSLDYEIIFVDDGSEDHTLSRLKDVVSGDQRVAIVVFRRNFGQTPALAAGIQHSRGKVIVPMDGDMQNDPRDIPAMLEKLDEAPGYDIVSGWRKNRQDRWLDRKLPSRIANWIIGRVTGVRLNDFGCSLKAYRREVIEEVSLYSELHRFLPALAVWHGAQISEMVVNHRPRTRGQTKYGIQRTVKVLLDLVTVKFLGSYMTKPLYFFGKIATITGSLCLLVLLVAIAQKFGYLGQPQGLHLNRNVLVTLSALLAFLSIECILFGIVSELLVRIFHQGRGTSTYHVREIYIAKRDEALPPDAVGEDAQVSTPAKSS
jgi:glycosyltransferase involved in cell wall biosynthesis